MQAWQLQLSVFLISFALSAGCAPTCCQADGPALRILAPESGTVIRRGDFPRVDVACSLGDVAQVVITCDSTRIVSLDKPPYTTKLLTRAFDTGLHMLAACAVLSTGEKVLAEPVQFSIHDGEPSSAQVTAVSTAPPGCVVLKEGTAVPMCLLDTVENRKKSIGSTVRLAVTEDVLGPGNTIVIPHGSLAYGKVTKSVGPRASGHGGEMDVLIESVMTAEGTSVPLVCSQSFRGKDSTVQYNRSTQADPADNTAGRDSKSSPFMRSLGAPRIPEYPGYSDNCSSGLETIAAFAALASAAASTGSRARMEAGMPVVAVVAKDTSVKPGPVRIFGDGSSGGPGIQVVLAEVEGIRRGKPLILHATVTPADPTSVIRVLIDDQEKLKQPLGVEPLEVQTKGLRKGIHRLAVYATLADGRVLITTAEFRMR